MNHIESLDTRETLRRAHEVQLNERIPKEDQATPPPGSYNAFVMFNLEAAFDEGHAILALGPIGGKLQTFSYYREGNKIKAPALMACIMNPMTFAEIEAASGWIQHGNPGNYWNEHLDAALGIIISKEAYGSILDYANATKRDPGTYDLVRHNCLTFVEDALEQGGVRIETKSGRDLRTFIPKDAFKEASSLFGAERFGEWKYWFPVTPAPNNGLRSISDLY